VYIDKNGKEKHPIILHRGLTGSLERTIGLLIEHYGGAFPLWLAPVQITLIPIADRHIKPAEKIAKELKSENIRVEIDTRSETMQAKIRDATLHKIPFMGIIGDREVKENFISVRSRDGKDLGKQKVTEFISKLKSQIDKKA